MRERQLAVKVNKQAINLTRQAAHIARKKVCQTAKKPLMRRLAMSNDRQKLDKKAVDCKVSHASIQQDISNAHKNVKENGRANRRR